MKTCRQSTMILFCDEMCGVLSHLDGSLLGYLCSEVTNTFQDTFLVEMTDSIPQAGRVGVAMDFLYGLDTTEEGSVALNLLPMVLAAKTTSEGGGGGGRASGEGLVAMAAKFHLLRTCEQQLNGNLEGIDALLGMAGPWGDGGGSSCTVEPPNNGHVRDPGFCPLGRFVLFRSVLYRRFQCSSVAAILLFSRLSSFDVFRDSFSE